MTRHKTSTLDLRSAYDRFIYALKEVSRCYGLTDVRTQQEIDRIADDTAFYLGLQTRRMERIKKDFTSLKK
jgi:hypothetical protein